MSSSDELRQNRYLTTVHCEDVDREVEVRGLPIGLSETPGRVDRLGPELGEHTEILLTEVFGYSWEDIDRFKAAGAIL